LERQARHEKSDRYAQTTNRRQFGDRQGKVQKPVIITDYNQHRGYADEGYRMAI
jgi:hypothetical protein